MLNFLNIAALAGLAGVAVPVLIHFFAKRKTKTVLFSSIAFLKQIQHSTIRRVKIVEWLLLVIRCLALIFIVLSFARPALKNETFATAGRNQETATAIVLDRSPSMAAGGAYRRAQDKAIDFLNKAAGTGTFALFWSDSISMTGEGSGNYRSILKRIEFSKAGMVRGNISASIQRALNWTGEQISSNKEIVIISDLQSSGFISAIDSLPRQTDTRLFVCPVEGAEENIAITEGGVLKQIIRPGKPVKSFAHVENRGQKNLRDIRIRMILNGETVGQKTIDLQAGENKRIVFETPCRETGWIYGIIEVDENRFLADNERYFAFYVPGNINVLLIGNNPGMEHPVFTALESSEQERHLFSLKRYNTSDNWLTETLHSDIIVLSDIESLTRSESDVLQNFVNRGGGVLFMPGVHTDLKLLDDRFLNPLLGVRSNIILGQGGYLELNWFDEDHVLISPIFQSRFTPSSPPLVFKNVIYSGSEGNKIIGLSDGSAFLTEFKRGSGKILLLSSGLDSEWSNLIRTTLFAPLIYQSVLYLAEEKTVFDSDLTPGARFRTAVNWTNPGKSAFLQRPGGEKIVLMSQFSNGRVILEYHDFNEIGFYNFYLADSLTAMAAVNIDPGESDLTYFDQKDFRHHYPGSDIIWMGENESIFNKVEHERYGIEIWREMLLLGLLMLGFEMGIAWIRNKKVIN